MQTGALMVRGRHSGWRSCGRTLYRLVTHAGGLAPAAARNVCATVEVLLPTERAHRVNTRSAQRGDVASQEGDEGNAQRGCGNGQRVVGLDPV